MMKLIKLIVLARIYYWQDHPCKGADSMTAKRKGSKRSQLVSCTSTDSQSIVALLSSVLLLQQLQPLREWHRVTRIGAALLGRPRLSVILNLSSSTRLSSQSCTDHVWMSVRTFPTVVAPVNDAQKARLTILTRIYFDPWSL